jgi:spermidine synthase
VFAQVVPYVSDEHEWAFLSGRLVAGPDPVAEMVARLPRLPVAPATLDADALRARSVLPFGIRRS